ncbi:MAG TPA: vitamin K epoxide reductase family protein [Stellaceae bacterium]|nr:vitamin K epoxide reductase family protein [Stellaceae bacterium]
MPAPLTRWLGTTPEALRAGILGDTGRAMRLRRAAAVAALVGIASMAATTLLQLGIVKKLPELPLRGFDTPKVNTSDEAYSWGGPDSPINILAHASSLVAAALGAPDRARSQPWLPLLAAGIELPQALIAAKYLFHQMPAVDRAWCPYCILDALTHFAILALTLPEAAAAARNMLAHAA